MKIIIKRSIAKEIDILTGIQEDEEYVEFLKQLQNFLSRIEINFDNYDTIINDFKCSLSDSNNEKKLNEHTERIIKRIELERYMVIRKNYEFTQRKINNKLGRELQELANILLDYLEIEKEKILKEIRDNKK